MKKTEESISWAQWRAHIGKYFTSMVYALCQTHHFYLCYYSEKTVSLHVLCRRKLEGACMFVNITRPWLFRFRMQPSRSDSCIASFFYSTQSPRSSWAVHSANWKQWWVILVSLLIVLLLKNVLAAHQLRGCLMHQKCFEGIGCSSFAYFFSPQRCFLLCRSSCRKKSMIWSYWLFVASSKLPMSKYAWS